MCFFNQLKNQPFNNIMMVEDCSQEFRIDYEQGIIVKTIIQDADSECRICLDVGNLIEPCACTSGIHIECLKEWMLTETNNNPTECEICKTNYIINFAAIFPDQQYVQENPISEDPISENTIIEWSTNRLININRLDIIVQSERNIRRIRNNRKKHILNVIAFLTLCDLLFALVYFAFCDTNSSCKEVTGYTTLSLSSGLISFFICGYSSRNRR
jgi:hypothetical protein